MPMSDEATSPEEEAAPEPSRPLSVDRLEERFASSVLSAEESHGTWTVVVAADVAHDALSFLQADDDLAYHHLSDLTAVDLSALDPADGGSDDGFHIVYHLASHRNVADPELRRLRVTVPVTASGPSLPTASDIWTGAEWAEREIWDMFGLRFDGHPDMRRLFLWDGFPGHPLRKDFPTTGYTEVRYDEAQKRVVYEPVSLVQEYRQFDFMSPWEGAEYVLPGDEKEAAK